jgi:hypothetical protein
MKTKLQTFLDDRDDNWPIHLATWEQLEAFAIAVSDDHSKVGEAYDKLTTDVFLELRAEAAADLRPPAPPSAAQPTKAA